MDFLYGQEGLLGFIYLGDTYLYEKNIFGDIVKIINSAGEVVGEYSYTAFGECTTITNVNNVASNNPFRYRGYFYEPYSGLYYLKTRFYNPKTGRFISPDDTKYLQPDVVNGLNLYAYCNNNPIMYVDDNGNMPKWAKWLIGGVTTAFGVALCFVPGGQVFGAGLIVSGVSGLAANTMDVMGLDSELAMKIQSGLNVVGGIGLSFVPGLGALGASMIGAGVLSFTGGYISEILGGSYGLGWSIGNVSGSIAGGMFYKGIVNKISTPSNMIKSFENHPNRWKLIGSDISVATGRGYRGGISNYSHYQNIWTKAQMGTHTITVNDIIKHFHYFFK